MIICLDPKRLLIPSPKNRPIVIITEKAINPTPAILFAVICTTSKKYKLLQCSIAPSLLIITNARKAKPINGLNFFKG